MADPVSCPPLSRLLAALLWLAAGPAAPGLADAATTVVLPASMCPGADAIFHDGYETALIPHDPSGGSGGTYPGNVMRTISVPGVGTRSYYLHLPPAYSPSQAAPLLIALHGAGGAGTAPTAAQQARSDWSGWADGAGFIVLAPVASGSSGGWVVDDPPGTGDDVTVMFAALADAAASYNVERSRVYLWGYSAGGHVAHAVALNNPDVVTAYGVNAGVLRAVACSSANFPGAPACPTLLAGLTRKVPVDIHIGSSDSLYAEAQADRTRFTTGGWTSDNTLHFVAFTGGHVYTVAHLGQIWNNLCPFALGP